MTEDVCKLFTFETFKKGVLNYGQNETPMLLPTVNIRANKRGDIFTIKSVKKWEPKILKGIVLDDFRLNNDSIIYNI